MYFSAIIKPVSIGIYRFDVIYDVIASMQTLKHGTPEAQYPDVYTDIFIFFLWSLCKIIWMNVHYFPNAPRMYSTHKRLYFKYKWIKVLFVHIRWYGFCPVIVRYYVCFFLLILPYGHEIFVNNMKMFNDILKLDPTRWHPTAIRHFKSSWPPFSRR